MNDFCSNYFSPKKKDEITVISLNINGLGTEGWTVKNNMVRDFILKTETDIVIMQEANVNWNKVSWRDR